MSKKSASSPPSSFDAKQADLIVRTADALLDAGVAQIPLRELAMRLDTSDRMLLYYFKDKEALVRASLAEVSARLTGILGAQFPARKISPSNLLRKAVPLFASPAVAPFMTVWADISARASRTEAPFHAMAGNSVRWWLDWLETRLDVEAGVERRDMAVVVLTVLEGARLLDASVAGVSNGAIRLLSRCLEERRSR